MQKYIAAFCILLRLITPFEVAVVALVDHVHERLEARIMSTKADVGQLEEASSLGDAREFGLERADRGQLERRNGPAGFQGQPP